MSALPFDFQRFLRPRAGHLDIAFWIDACLIFGLFTVLSSRYVLAPGFPISLPQMNEAAILAAPTTAVASLKQDNMVLFEGGLYRVDTLRPHLEAFVRQQPEAALLVRADRQVSVQSLVDLCEAARAAGFTHVQLAAEAPGPAIADPFP